MTDTSNGEKALATLERYVNEHGWAAKRMPDQTAFKAKKDGEHHAIYYYFEIEVALEQFLFYIAPEISLFQQQVPPMAEFVCRANYGMRIGCWDLDFKAGKISFRSSINFKGVELTPTLIDNTIQPALAAFDEFFPGVQRVFAGLDTPADAILKIEYGE
jgi:hypothetical protein